MFRGDADSVAYEVVLCHHPGVGTREEMLDAAGAVCMAGLGKLMAELIFEGGPFDAPENAQAFGKLGAG